MKIMLLNCFSIFVLCAFKELFALSLNGNKKRSFSIDMERNTFLKDGEPFQYISGGLHYFRVPHLYWEDRIAKMAAAGLDVVETYVAWNVHEPELDVYDFEGQNNLTKFFELVQKYNMYVILRPGPYICAEWDFGGLPGWLLSFNFTMNVRRVDFGYIWAVEKWFSKVLPLVRPYLYVNGGPILMVQVENEYGSYLACDNKYMSFLADRMEYYLGRETLLFTTDGNNMGMLKCGSTAKAFATVDFGVTDNVSGAFQPMRDFNNGKGPLVNSELYSGWLDAWGDKHHYVDSDKLVNTMKQMMVLNASYNLYMFEGGTTFGFMNGANHPDLFQITSYDYDAPLTEAGDVTEKFLKIRKFISQWKPNLPPVPKDTQKHSRLVEVKQVGSLLDLLDIASTRSVATLHPLPMERVHHYYGFILYRHVFKEDFANKKLSVPGLRDRGHVLLDGMPVGILDVNMVTSLILTARMGQTLDILVENLGRFNYGSAIMYNQKGIIGNVSMGSDHNLTHWSMHPIDFGNFFNTNHAMRLRTLKLRTQTNSVLQAPSVYMAAFQVREGEVPSDTFLRMCGWTWGVVYVNGINLGRYRPKTGPQVTLYLPSVYLKPFPHWNIVLVFETENVKHTEAGTAYIVGDSQPRINGTCF